MSVDGDELGAAEAEAIAKEMSEKAPVYVPPPPLQMAGGRTMAIVPRNSEEVQRIATAVVQAGMAPRGLETVVKCVVAILHGLEVGLLPMQALQSIAVINGRPSIYGDGALGLVRASNKLEYIRESINDKFEDNLVGVCVIKRKNEGAITRRFSQKDATTAGLWTKRNRDGTPGVWQLYPKRMLQMRARSWAMRDGFADVLKGLSIAEEMNDMTIEGSLASPQLGGPPGLEDEPGETVAELAKAKYHGSVPA